MSDQPDERMLSRRFEFPVERGKILEFARAIHCDNHAFSGRDAIAPPTFLMVGGQIWGYSWESPGDSPLAREQIDGDAHAPPRGGVSVRRAAASRGRASAGPVAPAPAGREGRPPRGPDDDLHDGDDVLARGWERGGATHDRSSPGCTPLLPADHEAPVQPAAETPMSPGDEPATRRLGPLRLEDFVRYQAASGDLNPYHYDPEVLAAAGGASLIAPGMLSAGVLGGLVADLYGAANVREIAFSFREPVLLGDVIICTALPADAPPERGETLLGLQCLRASGDVAVAGSARVIGGPPA